MSHSIEWNNNNAIIKLQGDITLNDILDIAMMINSDERFSNMKYRIYDFTNANSFTSDKREMENLVEIDNISSSWNKDLKIAVIAEDDDTVRIVIDFAKNIHALKWQIEMFPTIQEGINWCEK